MRNVSRSSLCLLAALVAASVCVQDASAQTLPAGFALQPIDSGWEMPVGVCFIDATRLLVAEKQGRVWLCENDTRKNLVVDLSNETLTPNDRGLLGIAVDPHFATNGWLYLLLVVDPNGDGVDDEVESFSRLVRYTTRFQPDGELDVLPASRVDLIGGAWSTGIPSCHFSHAIGNLRFMSDGSLVFTTGDGGNFDLTDTGGHNPACFGPGKFAPDQDIGAYRSQYDDSYSGKVLRIDPATGLGLPDNPLFTGNPADVRSRVWAKGLRNPFRFTLVDGGDAHEALIIGDVGWNTWEELNVCRGGENFGWPCFEGALPQTDYTNAPNQSWCASAGTVTAPLIAMKHTGGAGGVGFTSTCISGVAVYHGSTYPPLYDGLMFFCDYVKSWVKCARLDANLELEQILPFASSMQSPIDLQADPTTGELVFISLGQHKIQRLRYIGSAAPPVLVTHVEPRWGALPLDVSFEASASLGGSGQSLTFVWDLGDGTTTTEADFTRTYTTPGSYHVRLTATNELSYSTTQEFLITPGNTPPVITSVTPANGTLCSDGQLVHLAAVISDLEDDAAQLPLAAAFHVTLVQDHVDHPDFATIDGAQGDFTFKSQGPGTHFKVAFRCTDQNGLASEQSLALYDAASSAQAHIVALSDATLRTGQVLSLTGHAHHPGDVGGLVSLTWSFGDGERSTVPNLAHFEDTHATHAYAQPGDYTLGLTATLNGVHVTSSATIHVVDPQPAVAIFAPLVTSGWINWSEQDHLARAAVRALAPEGTEVALFHFNEQSELEAWMQAYLADGVRDTLVIFDSAPWAIYHGQNDGSLAELWLDNGNGIVWSGNEAFGEYVLESGVRSTNGAGAFGADEVLDAALPQVCRGFGLQLLQPAASVDLPSLVAYDATRALRYDQLGPGWSVGPIYAADADQDADTIVIENAQGGFYAQFLCTPDTTLHRQAVLIELLRSLLH